MAGRIPRNFIDNLLDRVDIIETIDALVPLKKAGKSYVACCPFHQEKTPSFHVNQQKQFYHCFGCGESGNVISFLIAFQHLNFVEAIETLAAKLGVEIPYEQGYRPNKDTSQKNDYYELLQQVSRYYQQQLRQHPQAKAAVDYLKQRGLSGEIAKTYALGFAPEGWDNLLSQFKPAQHKALSTTGMLITKDSGGYYDRFRHRVMFPIRDKRGRVVAFGGRVLDDQTPKYLNSPETPVFHKGEVLYGLYEALQANNKLEQVVIVEGYMDVVALAQHGITYALATLGTATSQQHIQSLLRYTNKIIFCFDGDRAGKEAAYRALKAVLSLLSDGVQIRFLFLPEGEDPDSMVRKEGTEAFQRRLSKALDIADVVLQYVQEQVDVTGVDGKARFIQVATPLINDIPEGSLQYLLLERIGRLVHLEPDRIKRFIKGDEQVSYITKPKRQTLPPALHLALILLLQNPQLVECIQDLDSFSELTGRDAELLQQLIQLIQTKPDITTGSLLEHWRDKPEWEQLLTWASFEHHVPNDGIIAEFTGALTRLQQQSNEQQINQLMQKASRDGLSDIEKTRLQQLIKIKSAHAL